MLVAASTWSMRQPKTYVVNLVPAVAAVGTPQGRPAPTPVMPPRPEEPAPRVSQRTAELPERELREGRPDAAARAADPRAEPAGPQRQPAAIAPCRIVPLPPRPSAAPRAGEKELPSVASSTTPRPAPAPTTATRTEPARPDAGSVARPPVGLRRRVPAP